MKQLTPLLIGVHGRARSGKDETFLAIQKWAAGKELTAARGAYADKMKLSIARCFIPNATMEQAIEFCNRLKADDAYVEINFGDGETIRVGGRDFHVNYGNRGHRDTLFEDIWVNELLPIDSPPWGFMERPKDPYWYGNFMAGDSVAQLAVVTDVRMENEAQRIIDLGGQIWKVNRKVPELNHTSEQPLPENMIDHHIDNNDGLPELQERVAKLLDSITDRGRKI